jgi:hypothetical protein
MSPLTLEESDPFRMYIHRRSETSQDSFDKSKSNQQEYIIIIFVVYLSCIKQNCLNLVYFFNFSCIYLFRESSLPG